MDNVASRRKIIFPSFALTARKLAVSFILPGTKDTGCKEMLLIYFHSGPCLHGLIIQMGVPVQRASPTQGLCGGYD